MTLGPAAGTSGCVHETGFYESDEECLAVVLPYVTDAQAADEPVYVACSAPTTDLLRRALPATEGVSFLPADQVYSRPAATIRRYREIFAREADGGAGRVRAVAQVPDPQIDAAWAAWRRYEAAVNLVFDGFPVSTLCLYDRRVTSPDVLHDALRAHPFVAGPDGRHANAAFERPERLLRQRLPDPDPLERTRPAAEVLDPTPAVARRTVAEAAAATTLGRDHIDDLVMAVSEAVTNAHLHGAPPVILRTWHDEHGMVVTVGDSGPGPASPLAGLVPLRSSGEGGLGLWILHQLLDDVGLHHGDAGFTIRLASRPRSRSGA